jgi:thymidylate kinase
MSTSQPTSALVAALSLALESDGISYCHWKSNAAIDRSLSAENDLDLLVERDQIPEFRRLLDNLGFIPVLIQRAPQVVDTEDFFGFDAETDRFVHVHAHYRLVLGHDRTKNYRVPIEQAYLESAVDGGTLRVPSPDFEYVVLVLRMALKYATLDEIIWQAARRRDAAPKPSEAEELDFLAERISDEAVSGILEENVPTIDRATFDAAVYAISGNATIRERMAASREIETRLQPYARAGRATDATLRSWRRFVVAAQRRTGRLPRFRPVAGGAIIAVIGGDGAGKSTVLSDVVPWLTAEFDTLSIHLGKPKWSKTTLVVRGGVKIYKIASSVLHRGSVAGHASAPSTESDYHPMVWDVCTARDRYLTYRRARRFAAGGGLVISDRYPHPSLQLMDAPQIARRHDGRKPGGMTDRFSRLETNYHEAIDSPDLTIILKVDPNIAADRKTDEPADYVRRRSAEIWNADWLDSSGHVIDASRPLADVVAEVRTLIWSSLG